MALGEEWCGTSFPWGICQAAYGPSTVLAVGVFSAPLCASWEGTHCTSVASAQSSRAHPHLSPSACLCSTSWLGTPGRVWAVHSVGNLTTTAYHWAGFPSCLGRDACSLPHSPWQSFQAHLLTWRQGQQLRGLSEEPCDPAAIAQERTPLGCLSVKDSFHVSREQPFSQKSPVSCERGHRLAKSCPLFSKETQNPVFVQAQFVPADFTFKLATVGYARARPGSWRVCPC